jgi:hypothetical protein
MGIKISQLPTLVLGNIRDANQLPVVDTTTLGTKKVTIGDIKNYARQGLSTVAFSGSYIDLQNIPTTFPIATATANQLGGVKVGAFLSVDVNGVLSATPGFLNINVGNVQLSSLIGSLNLIGGNNVTIDADDQTNTIVINSSGGGGGGSGNVGKGTTGSFAVYFNTTTVTGTNITTDGDSIVLPGVVTASGLIADRFTTTSIVTAVGDLVLSPNSNVSVTGKRIVNMASPVGSNDAATKAYVDAQSSRAFGKVGVPGQSLVLATSATDTVNFAAGNNVTLTTNPATKTVTIAVNNTLSFALLPATTSSIGGIIVGSGLTIDGNGVLGATAQALTSATTATLGGIIIGDGLSIDGTGKVSAAQQFSLNSATSSVLGGVKIGFGLSIDSTGVLSVPTQVLTTATKFLLGGVKIGNSIAAAVDGTIDVNASGLSPATTSTLGVVKPGYGLSVRPDGSLDLGVDGNFTITGNLSVNGVISATNIFTTGTAVTIISSANDLQLRAVGQVITNTTLYVNTSTPASSTSTGALQVWGGIGIGKNIITGEASIINGVLISGSQNSGGTYNIAIGSGALNINNGGSYQTAIGYNALQNSNSNENTALGYNAGNGITSGSKNTTVGISAASGMASGTFNSVFGHQSYVGQGASSYNTVFGSNINAVSNQPQSYNTFLGYNIANNSTKIGSYNIAIGGNNLQATTGTSNIVIGYGAGSGLTSATNQVIIGGYSGNSIATQTGYISIADGIGTLRAQWDNKGQVTIFNTATFYSTANASNSTNSGAVIVAGGMGVGLDMYVGGSLYVAGSQVVTQAYLGTPIGTAVAGTDTKAITVGSTLYIWNTSTFQSITERGNATTNQVYINSAAGSTGTTTGALIVVGAIATAQDVNAGSKVNAGVDSTASSTATTIGLFDRGRRVLTKAILIGDLGIEVTTASNTATEISYNIKNTGVRLIDAGNDIEILANGTSVVGNATGTVTISATSNFDTVTRRGAVAGVPVKILSTSSASTTSDTGGLVVSGGLGLTGALNITGSITLNGAALTTASVFNGGTITGALFVNNVTNSTSTSIGTSGNGAISTPGGISVAKDLNIGGNIYINGTTISTSTTFNGGSITGVTTINNATTATSTTTGALRVTNGGLGVGHRIYSGAGFYQTTATGAALIGYGPIFSASLSGTQSIASGVAPTKVTFQTKDFDPGGLYDNASTFRFLPTTPGYYQVSASVLAGGVSATGFSAIALYKNSAAHRAGNRIANNAAAVTVQVSAIVQMNGTSDFLEVFYAQTTGGAMTLPVSSTATYFTASYVRGI